MTGNGWLEPDLPATLWAVGRWSLLYSGGEFADITFAGRPFLRSVSAVARDEVWGTVPCSVVGVTAAEGILDIQLEMKTSGVDIAARLTASIESGALTIGLAARLNTDFRSNRLGLIVLHDQRVSGSPLRVSALDGSESSMLFPPRIAPHQPATNIRRLAWDIDSMTYATDFTGNVFEMEDQRNWSDASFKTYSGLLSDPRPVNYVAGDVVNQTVRLSAVPEATPRPRPHRSVSVRPQLVTTGAIFPDIQLGASTGHSPLVTTLELPAQAILVEIDAAGPWWRSALARARVEAAELPLDVRIAAGSAEEVWEVVSELDGARRIAVFDRITHTTTPLLWEALVSAAEPGVELTAGTRGHFTQLNRNHRALPETAPALCFSLTPQVHSRELRQILESVSAMRHIASDAGWIAAGRPLDIGPVTLRPRINIDLPGDAGDSADVLGGYGAEDIDGSTDSRIKEPALVAWTIAMASEFAVAGVRSLSLFETSGPRGVHDASGAERPVFAAVQALSTFAARPLLTFANEHSAPKGIIAVGDPEDPVLLAANLTAEPRKIELGAICATLPPWSAARLDRDTVRLLGEYPV